MPNVILRYSFIYFLQISNRSVIWFMDFSKTFHQCHTMYIKRTCSKTSVEKATVLLNCFRCIHVSFPWLGKQKKVFVKNERHKLRLAEPVTGGELLNWSFSHHTNMHSTTTLNYMKWNDLFINDRNVDINVWCHRHYHWEANPWREEQSVKPDI